MSLPYTFKAVRSNPESDGASIQVELIVKSELGAVRPVVEELMHFIKKSNCVPGHERDVEVALLAALNNSVLHGNREDPGKHVHISCRCGPGKEVSFTIRDEGQGFDTTAVLYPSVAESPKSHNQRGIPLMRTFMDEVHFEQGGREVHMRKRLLLNADR
jgi:serine/threonine-protein kinase RsbW